MIIGVRFFGPVVHRWQEPEECKATMTMKLSFDREARALYIDITTGEITGTIELDEGIYVDVDAHRRPLGIEFGNADDFIPFLEKYQGDLGLSFDVQELIERKSA